MAMVSELAARTAHPSATLSGSEVDRAEVAGSSGQAQENRSIRLAQAVLAGERARVARDSLHELAVRARAITEELRAQRTLREARLELTGAERSRLAGLWDVVPRPDRAPRARGLVAELLGYASSIPGVAHAGITVWDRRRTVAWAEGSTEIARALSIVQSVTGGPGRDAADTRTPQYTGTEHGADPAWKHFCDAAVDLGVLAVLAVPVHDGGRVGSLDLYACAPGGVEEHDRDLGRLLGRYAGIALRRHALAAAPPPVGAG